MALEQDVHVPFACLTFPREALACVSPTKASWGFVHTNTSPDLNRRQTQKAEVISLLLDVAETQVLQGRVAVSGGVVRPPSAGQVLEQRQPPVPLAVWGIRASVCCSGPRLRSICAC